MDTCAPSNFVAKYRTDAGPVALAISATQVPYLDAMAAMEARVAGIIAGTATEQLWLLEHPPLYTAGTSAKEGDLLRPDAFPVFKTGRGGQYTYHGPGQRVGYVVLNLKARSLGAPDIRCYVDALEEWLIRTLATFDVTAERRPGRVGLWVANTTGGEDKIAAIGVRVRHWVTFHGVALNVNPDLSHYAGIVPCGVRQHGVTSLKALGILATMAEVDTALAKAFQTVFGAELSIMSP